MTEQQEEFLREYGWLCNKYGMMVDTIYLSGNTLTLDSAGPNDIEDAINELRDSVEL